MPNKLALNLPDPAYWIRQFIFNELKQYSVNEVGVLSDQALVPIVPAGDSTAYDVVYNELLSSFTGEATQPLIIQYDKLMRFRTNPFYRIKKEQIILTINHPDVDIVENVTAIIEHRLDREDEAAQDVNGWAASNFGFDLEKTHNVYFHKIRVFKVDESRDLVELTSNNLTFARTRVIIEFDYHVSDLPNSDEDYK